MICDGLRRRSDRPEVVDASGTDALTARLELVHVRLTEDRAAIGPIARDDTRETLVRLFRDLDETLVEVFGVLQHETSDTRPSGAENTRVGF